MSDQGSSGVLVEQFKKGLYQHYKGNNYNVLDLVRHSESEEWLVLYQPCYGEQALWVRPIEMFFESVAVSKEETVERFKFVR
jgi:hypothetical protein